MKRYLRIYRTFFLSSLVREMEFRANFFAKIAVMIVWTSFFVIGILLIFRNTQSIAGWNQGQVLVLTGSAFLLSSFNQAFFFSITEIPSQVQLGTLDFIVTRPMESQFWISLRRFNLDQIGSMLTSSAMIAIGINQSHSTISSMKWGQWLVLMLCSITIFYSFNFAMFTSSIWFVKLDNLFVITEATTNVSRNPMDIFSRVVQRIFIFAIPLAFLAYMPAKALLKHLPPIFILYAITWALFSFLASRSFWTYATKHYSSASA